MPALFRASVKQTNKMLGILSWGNKEQRNRKHEELLGHEKMLLLGTLHVNKFFLFAKYMFEGQINVIVNVPGAEEIQLVQKQTNACWWKLLPSWLVCGCLLGLGGPLCRDRQVQAFCPDLSNHQHVRPEEKESLASTYLWWGGQSASCPTMQLSTGLNS